MLSMTIWDFRGTCSIAPLSQSIHIHNIRENIYLTDIRVALTNENTITRDLEYLREKFDFSDSDMLEVPQNPFYLGLKLIWGLSYHSLS